jgi:Lipid A core - O-antigen ligase and related enzymes
MAIAGLHTPIIKSAALARVLATWQFYCLFGFFLTLALPNEINVIFLITSSVIAVLVNPIGPLLESTWKDRLFKFVVLYFVLIIASYLRDSDTSSFFSALERRYPIVVLPVVFMSLSLSQKQTSLLLKAFLISVIAAIVASLVAVYTNVYWNSFNLKYFSWELSQNTIIPSNYLAMYTGFALVIAVHDWGRWKLSGKAFNFSSSAIFFSFLLLSGARMPFLATMVTLALLGFAGQRSKGKLRFVPLLVVAATSVLSIVFVPYLRQKFTNLISKDEPRYYQFKAAAKLISHEPILGYGPQGSEEALVQQYQSMGFELGVAERFNAHNEFLQMALVMGIPAGAVLIVVLILFYKKAASQKNFLPIAFLIMLLLMLMVEVVLLRVKGVIFFAGFMSFFLFTKARPDLGFDARTEN